tara:strand:+ start:678 stop:1808 length:1131 start_codon:yes stop_codon:yes gene_type:complete
VNFKSFVDTCMGIWKQSQQKEQTPVTVTVLGPPGTGKTSAGRLVAERMTTFVQARNPTAPPAVCFSLDLSSMLPEDLMGLPFRSGDVTRYCPQSWMAPLCEEGAYGVLILDDLPAAAGNVQVACRQVSLERRIHEMKLADGIFIIVTGNRREDKSAATTLPAHFRNSVVLLPFSPDFEGWEAWYMDKGFESDIPAFLHYKRDHFSRLPKDADKRGAFATPRTWSMLGQLIGAVPEEHVPEVASGLVGDGVASEYAAFRMLRRELVDPEQVLENPRKAVPDLGILDGHPDRVIALVTGLGEVAARKAKGQKTQEVLTKFLRALAYVTSKNREYVSVGVSTFRACTGSMRDLLVAARKGNDDPDIKDLISYLAKTLEQ